jgi:hypothetical protein
VATSDVASFSNGVREPGAMDLMKPAATQRDAAGFCSPGWDPGGAQKRSFARLRTQQLKARRDVEAAGFFGPRVVAGGGQQEAISFKGVRTAILMGVGIAP